MNKFWQNLNERERWMVGMAFLAVMAWVFYALLYSPVLEELETNTALLKEKMADLQWMKQLNPASIQESSQKKVSNNQLITLIATELKNTNVQKFPYQLQQTSSGEIQLSFEKVPFQYIITWLAKLKENYRFTIKQFTVEKTETPGLTRFLLILSVE